MNIGIYRQKIVLKIDKSYTHLLSITGPYTIMLTPII